MKLESTRTKSYKMSTFRFASFILSRQFKTKVEKNINNNGFLQIFLVQRFAPRSSFCRYWSRKTSVSTSFVFAKKNRRIPFISLIYFSIHSEKDPILAQAGKQAAIASINVFNDVMDGKNVTDALLDRYVWSFFWSNFDWLSN